MSHEVCSIDDCDYVALYHGICVYHYRAGQSGESGAAKAAMADLGDLSKTRLKAIARTKGITVPADWDKPEILAAIRNQPADDDVDGDEVDG